MAVIDRVEETAETPRAEGLRLSSAPLVARNALYNTLSMVLLTLLGLFCSPYIVHHLGTSAYGLFVLVGGVAGYFAMLDLGLVQAVMKYASEYYGRGDMERLSRLIGTANLIYLGLGAVGAGLIVSLTGVLVTRLLHIELELRDEAYFCLYLAAFGFFVNMPLSVFNALPMALQRMDIASARNTFVGVATSLGMVGLLHFGYGLRAVMMWQVAWTVLGVVVFVVASRKLLPGVSFRPRYDREEARRLFAFGVATAASSLGAYASRLDRILLGSSWLHGSTAFVTYYAIPLDVCQRGRGLTEQVTRALFPAVSDRSGNGDHEGVQRMYLRATRLLASLVVPALVLLGVFAYPVLNAWQGADIAGPSAPVLVLAAAAFCFQFVGALQNMFLSAMGRVTLMAKWNLAAGALTVLLDLLLIPRHGAVGAAAALLIVSLGVMGPFTWFVSGRVVGVPPMRTLKLFVLPVLLSLACFLPARAFMSHLHGLHTVGPACLALGGMYVLIAVLLRVIPREDLALVWGMVRKKGERA